MREVKHKSAVPIYITAGVIVLFCLIFPLYKLWHFCVLAVIAIIAGTVSSKFFPGTVEYIDEPKEPVKTGNEEIDALLREGEIAVNHMRSLQNSIKDEQICLKIDRLAELTDKIFKDVVEDPDDYNMIRRFSTYFLPTTLKLLNAYDRMGSIDVEGENITSTKDRIAGILDSTIHAYEKQLDALFANQSLDIETDIAVLENLLKMEGLSSSDFNN